MGLDEYQTLGWALLDDGRLIAFRPDTGEIVTQQALLSGEARITASSLVPTAGHLAVARSDGSLQCVNVEFHTTFVERHDAPEALTDLTEGQIRTWEHGVLELTPQGQLRRQEVIFHVQEPQPLGGQPVRALAHNLTSKGPVFAVLRDGGQLQFVQWRERRNVLSGATTIQSTTQTLPLESCAGQWPSRLFAPSHGDTVLAVWDDGWTVRYDLREPAKPVIAESLSLLPAPTQATITAAVLAIGGETLLVGDSAGGVRGVVPRATPERAHQRRGLAAADSRVARGTGSRHRSGDLPPQPHADRRLCQWPGASVPRHQQCADGRVPTAAVATGGLGPDGSQGRRTTGVLRRTIVACRTWIRPSRKPHPARCCGPSGMRATSGLRWFGNPPLRASKRR